MFGVPVFRPRTSNGYDPRVDVASKEEAAAMNVNVAGCTTGVLDANSADAAQREAELRNRHQEQFNKLRARLRSLETESAIMSQPVLELRRKQQELLASKRYAEAFEHMKIIKAAEKEVMQAHREEHRRVNEESVRKLLEDQAKERESLRKSFRGGAGARVQTHPRSPGFGNGAGHPAERQAPGRGGFDAGASAVFAAGVAATEPRSIHHASLAWRAPSSGVYYYDVPSTADSGGGRDVREGQRAERARRVNGVPVGKEEEASQKRIFDARRERAPVSARAAPPPSGPASMRSIPDTWQATAVNARPRGADVGAPRRAEPRVPERAGAEPLDTAASALLGAALALVGGEGSARALGGLSSMAHGAGGAPRESASARPDGDARSGTAPSGTPGVSAAGERPTETTDRADADPDATPAAGSGAGSAIGAIRVSSANARDVLVSGVSKMRAGAAARDAFRSTRRLARDDGEDEDDDLDDAPLAVLGAPAPNAGGHVVPGIDFSRLDLSGVEQFSRDARDEAPAAAPPERGVWKFLNASAKDTSPARARLSDDAARGEGHLVSDAGEDAADNARRGDADGEPGPPVVASASPRKTESRDAPISRVKKKTAAAKLLMRKASLSSATKAPRDDESVSKDSLQFGHGDSRRPEEAAASTDAATSERSSLASFFDADSPLKPGRAAPAAPGAPRTEAERAAEAERENRVAEVQKRQFTTEDFRNLFSYSRHGKYKQVTDLLKKGCPAEGRDKFGNSPLIIACQNGNARIVKALLRHGANIDAQNKQGCTGLHYCIAYGFNSLSDYLIAKGANDKLLNKIGLTPYEGIK